MVGADATVDDPGFGSGVGGSLCCSTVTAAALFAGSAGSVGVSTNVSDVGSETVSIVALGNPSDTGI